MPIGPLMIEHRLIEKILPLLSEAARLFEATGRADPVLVDGLVDFIRTYADRCHHGKEEDLLFRELHKKPLTADIAQILEELIGEHRLGRQKVKELLSAKEDYLQGTEAALKNISGRLRDIAHFYPKHIEKEDKHFFLPSMEYFSGHEQDALLREEMEFDRNLIHELYRGRIDHLTARLQQVTGP